MLKSGSLIILLVFVLLPGEKLAMAIEEASYQVVKTEGPFELRDYAPHIVAQTLVDSEFEEAGSKAFRRLFRYISGDNRSQTKLPMTAPVRQQKSGDRWVVSFIMPASYSLETLPAPDDPQVTLRHVPAKRMAAVRYSGFWSAKNYHKNKLKLDSWIQKEGLKINGDPIWARYNPPFYPWFLRRNEILIPVSKSLSGEINQPANP